jgi:LuxR family maltose regulon positive regulatory protein
VEEAAAVLGESVAGDVVLVIDECEALADDGLSVVATLIEYAPPTMITLILAREHLGGRVATLVLEDVIGLMTDADLRLTVQEARDLLAARGVSEVEADQAFAATGGWMAAIVFGSRFPIGARDGSEEFFHYLAREVLGRLPADEQRFLLDTSVVDIVTPDIAATLIGHRGPSLYERLRARHLPATSATEESIVYHSVLRRYLRSELLVQSPDREAELLRRYAQSLVRHGGYDSATELYLTLGDLDAAAEATEGALPSVYRRADWSTLLRWLDGIGEKRAHARPLLVPGQHPGPARRSSVRAGHGSGSLCGAQGVARRGHDG